MAVDADDNVWICDANGATVMKLSADGRLLMTIGTKGHRGDWKEAKGQRLLWQPLMLAFARNGDIYIGEGHANRSPIRLLSCHDILVPTRVYRVHIVIRCCDVQRS